MVEQDVRVLIVDRLNEFLVLVGAERRTAAHATGFWVAKGNPDPHWTLNEPSAELRYNAPAKYDQLGNVKPAWETTCRLALTGFYDKYLSPLGIRHRDHVDRGDPCLLITRQESILISAESERYGKAAKESTEYRNAPLEPLPIPGLAKESTMSAARDEDAAAKLERLERQVAARDLMVVDLVACVKAVITRTSELVKDDEEKRRMWKLEPRHDSMREGVRGIHAACRVCLSHWDLEA